jgi:two-component system, cell cycle response regulator DivK
MRDVPRCRSRLMTRILYVEDNDDNFYMLKMRFELLCGFEVIFAENGEEGYAMAAAENPDLIPMDLDLPVIDGWEATRRLKSNPTTKQIPIIGPDGTRDVGIARKGACGGLR